MYFVNFVKSPAVISRKVFKNLPNHRRWFNSHASPTKLYTLMYYHKWFNSQASLTNFIFVKSFAMILQENLTNLTYAKKHLRWFDSQAKYCSSLDHVEFQG